jgi:hypothetical protein
MDEWEREANGSTPSYQEFLAAEHAERALFLDRFIETHGLAPLASNHEVLSDFLERSGPFASAAEAEVLLERMIQLRPDQVVRRPHGGRRDYTA